MSDHDFKALYFNHLSKQLDIISSLSEIGFITYEVEPKQYFISGTGRLIFNLDSDTVFTTAILTKHIHPDDMDIFHKIYDDFLSSRGDMENIAELIRIKNKETGEYQWYMLKAIYLYSEKNDPISISFSFFNASFDTVPQTLFDRIVFVDDVTGLPNKRKFYLDCQDPESLKGSHVFCAIRIADSHTMQNISNRLKREMILKKFGEIIQSKAKNNSLYAYFDNSTFAFTFPVINNPYAEVEHLAYYLKDCADILTKNENEDYQLYITGGYCLYSGQHDNKAMCMDNALVALNRNTSKNKVLTGANIFLEYNDSFNRELIKREQLLVDLQRAMESNDFVPFYQPKIYTQNNTLCGMEALIRWNHNQKGLLSPGAFIPLAEETGLISGISHRFMEAVCNQNKQWQTMGYTPQTVSVNISPTEFYESDIVKTVGSVLQKTGLNPSWLELEITEGIALSDTKAATSKIKMLKELGVQISIDDFGSGYSSLSYLKSLPADVIKIDKSLIDDIHTNISSYYILQAIVTLLKKLDKKTICEGVETKEQAKLIKQLGVHCVQGFYYSKPVPASAFEEQYFKGN